MPHVETREGWEAPAAGRRRTFLAVALGLAAAGALLGFAYGRDAAGTPHGQLLIGRDDPGPLPARPSLPAPAPAPLGPVEGTWSAHGEAPVPVDRHRAVWTGSMLVVAGGLPDAGRGPAGRRGHPLAAWDAAGDTWTRLEAPVPARTGAIIAWTGREVLLLGGADPGGAARQDGATWDPATGRWRVLAPAGVPQGFLAGVWTGERLHVWARAGGAAARVHAYDPVADVWEPAASPALQRIVASGAGYARGRPLVWGRAVDTGEPALLVGESRVDVGAPPGFEPATVAIADDGVIALGVSGGRLAGARYRLGRGWEPLATIHGSGDPGREPPWSSSVWTGRRLVFTAGSTVAAYDPAGQRWEDLGVPDGLAAGVRGASVAWTGDRLLLWGGDGQGAALHAWTPATAPPR